MRKFLAGLCSRLADLLYPPYPVRQRRTVTAHILAGGPELADTCLGCAGDRFTLPLTAILNSGVMPAGSVTVCPECDTALDVVRYYRESRGWNN